jgi:hypothetical protein
VALLRQNALVGTQNAVAQNAERRRSTFMAGNACIEIDQPRQQ